MSWFFVFQVALETQPTNLARNFITKLLKEENVAELTAGTKTLPDFEVNGMDMAAFNAGLEQLSSDFLKIHSSFARQELSLLPGEHGIVANGYVVGPLQKDFGPDDFRLLEKYIESYGAVKLSNELHRLHIFPTTEKLSDVVMMTSALLSGLGGTEVRNSAGTPDTDEDLKLGVNHFFSPTKSKFFNQNFFQSFSKQFSLKVEKLKKFSKKNFFSWQIFWLNEYSQPFCKNRK